MPIQQNVFSTEWQKAIRNASPDQQKWFVAGVFGLKKPELVDASKIEVAYNSDNDKYMITAHEKHSVLGRVKFEIKNAELLGQDLQKLIDRITPSKPENNPDNIYTNTLSSTAPAASKPPKNAPPPIPTQATPAQQTSNQYGVVPRKKSDVEATHNYGPVGPEPVATPFNPTTTSSGTTHYGAMPTLSSPPQATPKQTERPSTTIYGAPLVDKRQTAILKSAASNYASSADIKAKPTGIIYGEMPAQTRSTDEEKPKNPKNK